MRLSLRWRILALIALAPIALAAAAVVTVNHEVAAHVDASSIHESLQHSVAVFEGMLATRSRALAGAGQVVAADPRFFSLVMLGPGQRDRRFTATVRGVALDFNRITQTDLFEVLDRRGRLIASGGAVRATEVDRDSLVLAALSGRIAQGVLVEPGGHYQAAAVPLRGDGRVVGVLLLGASIGGELAHELKSEMRCDVTFLSGREITGTTLEDPEARHAVLAATLDPGLAARGVRSTEAFHLRGRSGDYLSLVRCIPGTAPERHQYYVLMHAFDPEVAFQHAIRQDLLALAAIALLLAVASALLLSAQILRPVHRLVLGAREMERGNYDHPLDVRRRDELGYLAEQFARMRRRERAYVGQLEQAARLKSEFISIASHELRTPLSVLSGYRDLLADGALGPLSDRQREAIEAMREYLARLTRIAEDATQVAQVQGERLTLDLEPCAIDALLRRSVGAAIAAGTGRAVRVETVFAGASIQPVVDAGAIEQAVSHLVTNAIRFTPDGGRVQVEASIANRELRIAVRDTGVGLSEERLAALRSVGIIERDADHHQTSTGLAFGSRGLGLGLSIARGIAEAHGGRLEIESQPDLGSTFTLVVPARPDARLDAAA